MNDFEPKGTPETAPPAPLELAGRVRRAVDDAEVRQEIRVRLDVEGGHGQERYEFRFRASGAGEVEVELKDELSGRAHPRRIEKLSGRDFAGLLRRVDAARLAEMKARPPIPPGSVVGRLEVEDGRQSVSVIFMADPGQAETAGYRMPPEIGDVVDQIYDLAAKLLGAKSVRP